MGFNIPDDIADKCSSKKKPDWAKEQRSQLMKKQMILNILEDYLHEGDKMLFDFIAPSLYLRISKVYPIKSIPDDKGMYQYHALDNWPKDLKQLWRSIHKIIDNPEKCEDWKRHKIINLIKNRWLTLNGIHYIKRA